MAEENREDQMPQTMEDAFSMLDLDEFLSPQISRKMYEEDREKLVIKAKERAVLFEKMGQKVDLLKFAQEEVRRWIKEKTLFFLYERYKSFVHSSEGESCSFKEFKQDEKIRMRFLYIEKQGLKIGDKVKHKYRLNKTYTIAGFYKNMYLILREESGGFDPFSCSKI